MTGAAAGGTGVGSALVAGVAGVAGVARVPSAAGVAGVAGVAPGLSADCPGGVFAGSACLAWPGGVVGAEGGVTVGGDVAAGALALPRPLLLLSLSSLPLAATAVAVM